MKKAFFIAAAVISVVISACFLCFVSSAAAPAVYYPGSAITAPKGGTLTVPVYIRDNPGIMGIHIIVGYPDSILTPVKVTRGECLTAGDLSDNIGAEPGGAFDVIWSNTENMTTDGVLFEVTFDVPDDPPVMGGGISFSVVVHDTFNEAREDVSFNTEGVFVTIRNDGGEDIPSAVEASESETENAAKETVPATTPDGSRDAGVSDETNRIEKIIVGSISEELDARNISDIAEVPEEQRDEFVNSVIAAAEEKINADGSTGEAAQDKAQLDDMVGDIKFDDLVNLIDEADESAGSETGKAPAPVNEAVIAVIVIVSAAAVAAAAIVIIKKINKNS